MTRRNETLPVGIVVGRIPGTTRWSKWSWRAVAVLPGAAPADWQLLREHSSGAAEFHAATLPLTLHRTDTEAYLHGLTAPKPSVYVIMRKVPGRDEGAPLDMLLVTASPYEAQDYADNGEDIVERVIMPPALREWVSAFVEANHQHEEFIKRRRDKGPQHDPGYGLGDPRITQDRDVYRSPGTERRRRVQ